VAAAQGDGMRGIYPPPHMTCMCCGEDHVVLALSDSSVWVWGRGTQGALGLGAQVFFMWVWGLGTQGALVLLCWGHRPKTQKFSVHRLSIVNIL
jgi:hypothetical protein